MIYDKMEHLQGYLPKELRKPVAAFLSRVKGLPPGCYEVAGDVVYANVHEYETSTPEACKVEAHDKYIDIQATLEGAEGITVYERGKLKEKVPYNAEKDVTIYEAEQGALLAHTENLPGYFTILKPEEAHRPQENVAGYGKVRKFVIKMRVNAMSTEGC